jgi:hypothetical protein
VIGDSKNVIRHLVLNIGSYRLGKKKFLEIMYYHVLQEHNDLAFTSINQTTILKMGEIIVNGKLSN